MYLRADESPECQSLDPLLERVERTPWVTVPGLSGALAALGIVGALTLGSSRSVPVAALAGIAAGAAVVGVHGWLTKRVEGN